MPTQSKSSTEDDAVVIDRDDISNYNPEHILPQSPEEVKKIRKWLQATDYAHESGEFRKHLASHMAGTGTWLTSSDTFNKWLDSQTHGTLWIKGIPGSGKSVVAAHLIDHLARTHNGAPVLYFFFRQIIDANHEPAALLRDWIDQVVEYSPPLQKELKDLVEKQRSLSSLSMDDLWGYLRMALGSLGGKAFCVADALDEMDQGNDEFLQALASLGQWKPGRVKILMTSRPVPGIEVPLRQADMLRVRLEETMVDTDILSFVERGLSTSGLLREEQDLIRAAIPGHANGIFLYAKLAMDAFLEPGARTKEVLHTLPADLHAMYTRLLHEHAVRSGVPQDIQLLILQWVTHATRPLRLLELAEIISVTYQQINPTNPRIDIKSAKDLVRAAAGPLLEILPNETVCVIHHSFTEYLKCMTRSETDGGYPILSLGSTHSRLAFACLVYLQAGCLDKITVAEAQSYDLSNYEDRETLHEKMSHSSFYGRDSHIVEEEQRTRLQYPFFAYAIANWHIHVARSYAAAFAQDDINAAIENFCVNDRCMKAWLKLQWAKNEESSRGITPLHVAARYGLIEFARRLLMRKVDPSAEDVFGKTPLWWAARSGHADVIRLLVQAGADPDGDEKVSGLKPLHEAANENHAEAVRALLEAGVDPLTKKTREHPGRTCGNAPTSKGHTPLMYACHNGHFEALEAFLPFLNDLDTVHRALAWSAERGRSKLVARILQHPGVDVNSKVRGDTPLTLACNTTNRDTIITLLEAGADPTILCSNSGDEFGGFGSHCYWPLDRTKDVTRGFTALHAFCNVGRRDSTSQKAAPTELQEVFSLLLEKGASISQQTHDGRTALHAAINSPVLTRLLLSAGADPNVSDDQGCVPLHLATSPDSVNLLLDEGHADIDKIRPSDGRTPLLCVLGHYNNDAIMNLLSYRPNLTIKDAKGDGPLHVTLAQHNTDTTVLRALLVAGADANERNRAGRTPLLVMRMNNRESIPILDLLLEHGADINARDPSGATLLFHSLGCSLGSRSDHSDIKALLERGADLTVRDYKGKTLLHQAVARYDRLTFGMARENRVTRLDFTLGLGLDTQVLDYDGNTLIHEAVLRSGFLDSYYVSPHIALLEKLLVLGIDINQGNNRGRTALHILAASHSSSGSSHISKLGDRDLIEFIITKVDNIDQRDRLGLTPLHLASTVSEKFVKNLLDAGADPSLASLDGLTPLHLAARARQSNVVGLLLKHKKVQDHSAVNALDEKKRTPLYYACRSGVAETVSLLLDAGADATHKSLLLACTEFETEQDLWNQDRHAADLQANQRATGLTVDDKTRPGTSAGNNTNMVDLDRNIPRLEEILDMLIQRGCDTPDLEEGHITQQITSALGTAARLGNDYTFGCLLRARDKVPDKEEQSCVGNILFEVNTSKAQQRAQIEVATNFAGVKPGEANEYLIIRFLKKRQYYTLRPLFDQGVNFLAEWSDRNNRTNLDYFAEHGYASLLDSIGTPEASRRLEGGKWHAYGDKSKPGLYCETNLEELKTSNNTLQCMILLTALRRNLPNMDVVRLLVEKFHVDINQIRYAKEYTDNCKYDLVPSETALHYLAQGIHWWHVALALPYLISKGADVNAKNNKGDTPLHIALGGPDRYVGAFHKEAARAFVAGGADVNARDGKGKSCLATAAGDIANVQLLLDRNVSINGDALLMAIDSKQIDVLETLLKAGADPNMRPHVVLPSSESNGRSRRRGHVSNALPRHEIYPLYAAATKQGVSNSTATAKEKRFQWYQTVKLVEALLSAGADPFATFRRRNPDYRERCGQDDVDSSTCRSLLDHEVSSNEYDEVTIIHELLDTEELVHPILQLDSLDANRRDAQGRTLLHVTSHYHALTAPIDVLYESHDKEYQSLLPSFLNCLLSRGADPLATDFLGRSTLHHLFVNNQRRHNCDRDIVSLTHVVNQYPSLVNQPDISGNTPLHMALKYAVSHCDIAPAEVLLDAGADPSMVNNNGDSCLHILSFRMYGSSSIRAIFARLLKEGLNINARNTYGETPIFNLNKHLPHVATIKSTSNELMSAADALAIFETAQADLFVRDNRGRSLLHVAAKEIVETEKEPRFAHFYRAKNEKPVEPSIARFKVLLEKGLDPMLEDVQKRTALDVAAAFGKESILNLFDKDYERPKEQAVEKMEGWESDDEDL
ncbi:Nn.00g027970.m01.CDS01 [Neocucurbitaria sp. VM-36]